MKNVQLIRTNFHRSNVIVEQILEATLIFNTILPNGSFIRNKTFVNNGDAKQGLTFWNRTNENIQIKDSSFVGTQNASMIQRINVTEGRILGSFDILSIDYFDRRFRPVRSESIDPRISICQLIFLLVRLNSCDFEKNNDDKFLSLVLLQRKSIGN